jgi:hypothetical protein
VPAFPSPPTRMASGNPFSPTFGASPPVLAGRDDILDDIDDAFETGPTHPDYTTLFIGIRGAGKTVMLNAIEDLAQARGWLTVSDNATPAGLLTRLQRSTAALLATLHPARPERRVSGVKAGGLGVEFELLPEVVQIGDLRDVLTALGDALAAQGTGLLITIDELQSGSLAEVREFGAVLQHVTRREQRPIAFAGAALPQIDNTLLSDDTATFLQRCSRYDVDRLPPAATRRALAEPITGRGGGIDGDALDRAVEATSGYAFMVQLVGFHSWKAAADPVAGITAAEVAEGVAEAERRIGRLVFAPTWRGLSDVDRRFLMAMAVDEGESRLADVAARLEVGTKYAGVYRRRLIDAGMIVATGKGRLDFAHHATREWLRNEPSNDRWRPE